MRIEGFSNQRYNIEQAGEKNAGSVRVDSLSDIVTFGSSLDSIFGESASKSSFLEGMDGSMESMKEQAKVLRDNLKAVFNKMDMGSVVEIDGEGIDINDTETDKMVTVVEQIQIKLAMYCDDFETSMNIDADAVKKVMGAGAAAYKIAEKFQKNGVIPTEDNVSETLNAAQMAYQIDSVSDGAKAYLLQNEMQPTINNVYVAANSGYVCKHNIISDTEWGQLMPQVNKVIEEAGLQVTKEHQQMGRWMLDNEIDVTADNFKKLSALDNVENVLKSDMLIDRIAAAMTEGIKAKDAVISGEAYPWEKAAAAVITLENATEDNIMALAYTDDSYTIETLAHIEEDKGKEFKADKNDYKYIKTYRELMEVKLMMTLDAARTMERNGISVNTEDISRLIERLKQYEADYFNANLAKGQGEITVDDVGQANTVIFGIEGLKRAPSAVIGSVINAGETVTVDAMTRHTVSVAAKIAAAGEAYEALSTEIRSDLGDSVSKAVKASASDILSDMGYEDNEAGRRAVRILAYNDMEINTENIDKVKSVDYSVNELFANMTPYKVLQMIRDGINPLETDVTELNNYFIFNETQQQTTEKYSEFLCRLERHNHITKEEREKFIGIYSLISKFEKDGMNAAGALVNQGLPLTIGNLLTAYMIRRDRNMDLTANDDVGTAQVKDKVTYYKNLFGRINGSLTPEVLMDAGENLDNMTPEQLLDAVNKSSVTDDDPVYREQLKNAKEAADIGENILKFIADNEIPSTYNNIFAAQALITNPRDIFGRYADRMNRKIQDMEEEITDALENKKSAMEEYAGFVEKSQSLIEQAIGTTDSYMDMQTLRQLGNGMRLLSTLANKNNYHIPYESGGRFGVINLKILESGENTGSFTIKMDDGRFGKVTIEGRMDEHNFMAQIMCSEAYGVEAMQQKKSEFSEGLAGIGIKDAKLYINRAAIQPEGKSFADEKAATEKIFRAAKIFIDIIAK